MKEELEHCIRVPKIYDWVTRFMNIKEKEMVTFPREIFKDCICCNFKVGCNESSPSTIWTALNTSQISATLQIKLTSSCGCALDIFVNGEKFGSITEGQSFNATVGHIQSVDVKCHGYNGKHDKCCCGEIKIVVHYTNECNLDLKKAKCFLSDSCGNPINPTCSHAITCKEIHEDHNRPSRHITLPNGKVITLQEVSVMKCGFITVQLFDKSDGKLCKCCTFPFSEVETFYLCAPPGTHLECDITDVECKVFAQRVSCECVKVFITINICQDIQIVGDVKLEVRGKICEPRDESQETVGCPHVEYPDSCPVYPDESGIT